MAKRSGKAGTVRHAPVSNMPKMAKDGFFHTAIEETKYRIKTPQAEV
jgi:hypothetical protein